MKAFLCNPLRPLALLKPLGSAGKGDERNARNRRLEIQALLIAFIRSIPFIADSAFRQAPLPFLFNSMNTTATTAHDGHEGRPGEGSPSCPSWAVVAVVFQALAEQWFKLLKRTA